MGKSFGENLLALIEKHNLSVRQFASKIDVSAKTCNEWVGKEGRFPANPEIIKKIAQYFSVSVHELLYGEPDPQGLIGSILQHSEIHSGYYKLTIEKVNIDEKKK